MVDEKKIKRFFRRRKWEGPLEGLVTMIKQRVGETPGERLTWVLRTAQRGVSALQPGEHGILGEDLRGCAFLALAPTGGYSVGLDDMPLGKLAGYLAAIDSGIRGLLSDPPKPWPFKAEPRLIVDDGTFTTKLSGKFAIQFYGDERAGILGGIAHLIVEVGDRLRACRECSTPFVATMRQSRYCSPKCSERKWNRERSQTTKGGSNG